MNDCDICGKVRKYMNDPHHTWCPYYQAPPKVAAPAKMGPCDCGSAKGGGGHYDWCSSRKPATAEVLRVECVGTPMIYGGMSYNQSMSFIDNWGSKVGEYFVAAKDANANKYGLSKTAGGSVCVTVGAHKLLRTDGWHGSFSVGDLVQVIP